MSKTATPATKREAALTAARASEQITSLRPDSLAARAAEAWFVAYEGLEPQEGIFAKASDLAREQFAGTPKGHQGAVNAGISRAKLSLYQALYPDAAKQ